MDNSLEGVIRGIKNKTLSGNESELLKAAEIVDGVIEQCVWALESDEFGGQELTESQSEYYIEQLRLAYEAKHCIEQMLDEISKVNELTKNINSNLAKQLNVVIVKEQL